MDGLNQCVFIDWFQYEHKCPIKSCKFNTSKTDSGCMAQTIGSSDGKKIVSDYELLYHKFSTLTISQVAAKRKEALLRVKKILVLYQYLDYLATNCKHVTSCSLACVELMTCFPFKLKKLGVTPQLLELVGEKTFQQFAAAKQLKENFELVDVLFMTRKQWTDFLEKKRHERKRLSRLNAKRARSVG